MKLPVGESNVTSTGPGTPLRALKDWCADVQKSVGAYGEAYEFNETGSTITVTTGASPTGTFYQWVTGAAGLVDGVNVTWNSTNKQLVIGTNGAGIYEIHFMAAVNPTGNREVQCAIHINGAASTKLRCDIQGTTSGDGMTVNIHGLASLSAADVVDVRFSSDTNATSLVLKHVLFYIKRIG